jgi:hypothetical protein
MKRLRHKQRGGGGDNSIIFNGNDKL